MKSKSSLKILLIFLLFNIIYAIKFQSHYQPSKCPQSSVSDIYCIHNIEKSYKNFKEFFLKNYLQSNQQDIYKQNKKQNIIFQNLLLAIDKDDFELKDNFKNVFRQIYKLFQINHDYFHVIPLLYIQKFHYEVLNSQTQYSNLQKQFGKNIQQLQDIILKQVKKQNLVNKTQTVQGILKISPIQNTNYNLFKQKYFFKDYQQLQNQINLAVIRHEKHKQKLQSFVQQIFKQTKGVQKQVNTKYPRKNNKLYRFYLRVIQKIYTKQFNQKKKQQIYKKLNQLIQSQNIENPVQFFDHIMNSWKSQVTAIIKTRRQNNIKTVANIGDLVRGRIRFANYQDLLQGFHIFNKTAAEKGYKVIELKNRAYTDHIRDIQMRLIIDGQICQLQLAIKVDQNIQEILHNFYQLNRSPIGVIFASYFNLADDYKIHFRDLCQAQSKKSKKIAIRRNIPQIAKYIVKQLTFDQ